MNTHSVRRANSTHEYELAELDAILTDHMQDPPTAVRSTPQVRRHNMIIDMTKAGRTESGCAGAHR
jgi:hypothetical protein